MKIQRVTVEVLETPLSSQYTAGGNAVSSNWHILARVYTEDGIQGIGFNVALRATLVKAAAHACQELGDLLVGMEVMEIEAARSRMERAAGWAGPGGMVCIAMAPLDIALWDAAGKTVNQPLYRMLGGYRDRVRTYASDALWYSLTPNELARSAQSHASAGFDMLKLRLGHEPNPQAEVDRVRAVQEAVGAGVKVMVDATESWTESQAMASGRALQEAGY